MQPTISIIIIIIISTRGIR